MAEQADGGGKRPERLQRSERSGAPARRSRASWVARGVAALLLVIVAVAVWRHDPVARGRSSDACRAKGPGALVGLDLRTGEVRWTNIVGDVAELDAGEAGTVVAREAGGRARVVEARTGDVTRCRGGSRPDGSVGPLTVGSITLAQVWPYPPEAVPTTGVADQAGAPAAPALREVQATRADGSQAWEVPGGRLLGASPAGVAIEGYRPEQGDMKPILRVQVRSVDSGAPRWEHDIWGTAAVVDGDHLVAVDQTNGTHDTAVLYAGKREPSRVTAYRLTDGVEAWHVEVAGLPYVLDAGAGTVFVPDGGSARLTALAAESGQVRWAINLPSPGRGGRWTEQGETRGVVVDEGAGIAVVAIEADEPYRD